MIFIIFYYRVYAEVVKVKNEFIGVLDGVVGPKYGFYRDPVAVAGFIKRFYEEAGVPPSVVDYVEAFGSGKVFLMHSIVPFE